MREGDCIKVLLILSLIISRESKQSKLIIILRLLYLRAENTY